FWLCRFNLHCCSWQRVKHNAVIQQTIHKQTKRKELLMKTKILIVFCFLALALSFNTFAQTTVLTVTLNYTNCGSVQSVEDNYTVTNASRYDYKVFISGVNFSQYSLNHWVKINGQTISYTLGSKIQGLKAGDVITIGMSEYPNPFSPPCPFTAIATLQRQLSAQEPPPPVD